MSKYDALEEHLNKKGFERIPMTFAQIESVIDSKLPHSARVHRAWWSNNPSNSVITHAWLAAGYKTASVNLEGEHLVFERTQAPKAARTAPKDDSGTHPAFGAMKGSVTIRADVDLTEQADPDWGRVYE